MDFNKIYNCIELYNTQTGDITEIADKTGLSESIVNSVVIKEVDYRGIYRDYRRDIANKTVTKYKAVEPVKINDKEYRRQIERMTNKLLRGSDTLDQIKGYLIKDDIDPTQITKILKQVSKNVAVAIEDQQRSCLSQILETLKLPEKWTLDDNYNIVNTYPKPIVENGRVTAVKYETDKNYLIPDDLQGLYFSLEFQD